MAPIDTGDRNLLRQAWVDLCRDLEAAGVHTIDELQDVDNSQELAEALRAVARMALMTLQHKMEFSDPDFPSFFRSLDDRYKYGGPDAYITYMSASVRGSATYRVSGNHRGRNFQLGRFWAPRIEYLDEEGSFEILLSGTEQPGNWQPLDPSAGEGPQVVPDLYPMAQGQFSGRIYREALDDDAPTRLSIERI